MAQQVFVSITDDLDGSEAAETITFDLDGTSYEIDLNEKNAAALRKALDKYVASARRSSARGASHTRATGRRPARGGDADPKAVRLWAQEHGLEVSSRGRIPAEILDRYRAAR
jgi:FMN phosphatase YigB (HAD superfamily)